MPVEKEGALNANANAKKKNNKRKNADVMMVPHIREVLAEFIALGEGLVSHIETV